MPADEAAFLSAMEDMPKPWPVYFRELHLRIIEARTAAEQGLLGSGSPVRITVNKTELGEIWGVSRRVVSRTLEAEEWRPSNRAPGPRPISARSDLDPVDVVAEVAPDQRPVGVPTRVGDHHDQDQGQSILIEGEGGPGGDQSSLLPEPVAPALAQPRNATEAAWCERVEPRILALGWRYDRADALSWLNRTRIELRSAGVTPQDVADATNALLDKAELGHVTVVNWKLTLRNWCKKGVKFRERPKGGSDDERQAGEVFDRLVGLVCSARRLPPDLDERTRAAWVAVGATPRAQRDKRENRLQFMRREFVAAFLADKPTD